MNAVFGDLFTRPDGTAARMLNPAAPHPAHDRPDGSAVTRAFAEAFIRATAP
ncbi:hypothetical protein [Nonomuraea sp. B19D2]|uniref:hypothetical protein n=1 Tax=Nonomuraea sp. B19D2 TaxID=3159561 RepID=UPI0032DAB3DB